MKEINLLPISRRKYLHRQAMYDLLRKFINRLNISLVLVTAAGIISLLVLRGASIVVATDSENEIKDYVVRYQEGKTFIDQQNQLVSQIYDADTSRVPWSEYITDVLSTLPPGTIIEKVSGSAQQSQIIFSGATVNRSALTLLETKLKSLTWVGDITSPLSNLLDRENPEFLFTITIKQGI